MRASTPGRDKAWLVKKHAVKKLPKSDRPAGLGEPTRTPYRLLGDTHDSWVTFHAQRSALECVTPAVHAARTKKRRLDAAAARSGATAGKRARIISLVDSEFRPTSLNGAEWHLLLRPAC